MSDQLQWVESAGGPLLLLPQDLLGFWEGVNTPPNFRNVSAEFRWNETGIATDSDRACDVNDYVGLIDVGPGKGLVLGDEPLATTWISSPSGNGGILVRCRFSESDEEIQEVLNSQLNAKSWVEGPVLTLDGSPLVLFDAAASGTRIESRLVAHLPKGTYRVGTLDYTPHAEVSLLLHRLKLL